MSLLKYGDCSKAVSKLICGLTSHPRKRVSRFLPLDSRFAVSRLHWSLAARVRGGNDRIVNQTGIRSTQEEAQAITLQGIKAKPCT